MFVKIVLYFILIKQKLAYLSKNKNEKNRDLEATVPQPLFIYLFIARVMSSSCIAQISCLLS